MTQPDRPVTPNRSAGRIEDELWLPFLARCRADGPARLLRPRSRRDDVPGPFLVRSWNPGLADRAGGFWSGWRALTGTSARQPGASR